jgi:hypothetical protein
MERLTLCIAMRREQKSVLLEMSLVVPCDIYLLVSITTLSPSGLQASNSVMTPE